MRNNKDKKLYTRAEILKGILSEIEEEGKMESKTCLEVLKYYRENGYKFQ